MPLTSSESMPKEIAAGLVGRVLAVDPLEVLADVAALGDPLPEVGRSRANHDVGHRPGLLALEHGPHRRRRVPDVADDLGAERLREAGPDDVDLGGLVVRRRPPRVGALRQRRDLPGPLEDRRLGEPHLAPDVLVDVRAVARALHVHHALAVLLDHREVVRRATPVLLVPAGRDALDAHRSRRPVLDDDNVRRQGRAGDEQPASATIRIPSPPLMRSSPSQRSRPTRAAERDRSRASRVSPAYRRDDDPWGPNALPADAAAETAGQTLSATCVRGRRARPRPRRAPPRSAASRRTGRARRERSRA